MNNYTNQIPSNGHMAKGGLRPVANGDFAISTSVTADWTLERTP